MLTSIPENWIACKDCDLQLERVATPPGDMALSEHKTRIMGSLSRGTDIV